MSEAVTAVSCHGCFVDLALGVCAWSATTRMSAASAWPNAAGSCARDTSARTTSGRTARSPARCTMACSALNTRTTREHRGQEPTLRACCACEASTLAQHQVPCLFPIRRTPCVECVYPPPQPCNRAIARRGSIRNLIRWSAAAICPQSDSHAMRGISWRPARFQRLTSFDTLRDLCYTPARQKMGRDPGITLGPEAYRSVRRDIGYQPPLPSSSYSS